MDLLLYWPLFVFACGVGAFYQNDVDVVELTASNFDDRVTRSNDVWLVEFFAPWCGHCQALTPEWKKAARALKGVVKVGAVNCDDHGSLAQRFSVQGFPSIKLFGASKVKPEEYQNQRNAQALVQFAMSKLQQIVNARLSGGGGGGGTGGQQSRDSSSDGDVIELTEANFATKVLSSDEPWLVEFFAPWCGHCKALAPHWQKAAAQLKGKVNLGAVDATTHQGLASQYGVRGYPTIKFFPAGAKTSSSATEYDGPREAEGIVTWATSKFTASLPPPGVDEVVSSAELTKCGDGQICVLSFLPHLLDCQSKCRQQHIEMLKKLADRYKRHNWHWAWIEGATQSQLESALEIGGFGYPAMVAINVRRMKFATLRGGFAEDGISEFLGEVSVGRVSSVPIRGAELPKIVTAEPWDGKDAQPIEEEDIDISDIVGKKKEL